MYLRSFLNKHTSYLVKPKYAINQLLPHLKGVKKGKSSGDRDLMLSLESTTRPERYNAKSLLCNLGAATAVLLCVVESINFYATCLT